MNRTTIAPHALIASLADFDEAHVANAEIGRGTLAVLAAAGTMGDASIAGRCGRILGVSRPAGAHVRAGTVGVQAGVAAVSLALGSARVQRQARAAGANVGARAHAVQAALRTRCHARVVHLREALPAGAHVGPDAFAARTAAVAMVLASSSGRLLKSRQRQNVVNLCTVVLGFVRKAISFL